MHSTGAARNQQQERIGTPHTQTRALPLTKVEVRHGQPQPGQAPVESQAAQHTRSTNGRGGSYGASIVRKVASPIEEGVPCPHHAAQGEACESHREDEADQFCHLLGGKKKEMYNGCTARQVNSCVCSELVCAHCRDQRQDEALKKMTDCKMRGHEQTDRREMMASRCQHKLDMPGSATATVVYKHITFADNSVRRCPRAACMAHTHECQHDMSSVAVSRRHQ